MRKKEKTIIKFNTPLEDVCHNIFKKHLFLKEYQDVSQDKKRTKIFDNLMV